MDYEKLLALLDQLKRGIEFCGWVGGKEFENYLQSILNIFVEIFTHGTVAPRIPAFLKDGVNKYIEKKLGYLPLTNEEWVIFYSRIYNWVDWDEAMMRTFWEEILPARLGEHANINQRYEHTFRHCNSEWKAVWYVDCIVVCPECGKKIIPEKSVPIPRG